MHGDGGRDIGKGDEAESAGAETVDEDGHAFAGVVGSGPRRVVAVVGGDDEEVAVAQGGNEASNLCVEPVQVFAVACGVTAVAEFAVEFDEIGEGECAVLCAVATRRWRWAIRSRSRPFTTSVIPRMEKMSPILPTAWTGRQASCAQSQSVGDGGAMA